MAQNWTDSQRQALNWQMNQCVSAGAGSGKTAVLSERYLQILLSEKNNDINPENILALTFTNKAANEMKKRVFLNLSRLSVSEKNPVRLQRIRSIKDNLPFAPISTMHSFCTSVLRDYSIESGIDPLFAVVDSLKKSELEEKAIDSILEEISSDPNNACFPELDYIATFLSRFEIKNLLQTLLRNRPYKEDFFSQIADERSFNYLKKFLKKDSLFFEEEHLRYQKAFIKIFSALIKKYDMLKGGGHLLDFADLEEKTIQILRNPKIAGYLQQKYKYVLVDEFQDTNFIQWDIISPLVVENGKIIPGKLFIVGDPQQSIYSFRGGDVRTFNTVRDLMLKSGKNAEEVNLLENFRSKPIIIDFTNYLFSKIKINNFLKSDKLAKLLDDQKIYDDIIEKYKVNFKPLNYIDKNKEHIESGSINFIVINDPEHGSADEAKAVAAKIHEIIEQKNIKIIEKEISGTGEIIYKKRDAQYSDIALLLRTSSNASTFEEAFRSFGIPFISSISSGFYSSAEICDILNLINFLGDENHDVSLVGILRSPFFTFSDSLLAAIANSIKDKSISFWEKLKYFAANYDPEKIRDAALTEKYKQWKNLCSQSVSRIEEWKKQYNNISLSEFIIHVIDETSLWLTLSNIDEGQQKSANLSKLRNMIVSFESENGISFREFIEDILERGENYNIKESQANVRTAGLNTLYIGTIHSVKGLEFPIVFVADGSHYFNMGTREKIFFDNDIGFGIKAPDQTKNNSLESPPGRQLINAIFYAKTILEEQRMLYVALTRAKDHLFFSAYKRKRKQGCSYLDFFESVFGEEIFNPEAALSFSFNENEYKIGNKFSLIESARKNNYDEKINSISFFENEVNKAIASYSESSVKAASSIDVIKPEAEPNLYAVTSLLRYVECPRRYYISTFLGIDENILHSGEEDELESEDNKDDNIDEEDKPVERDEFGLEFGTIAHAIFSSIVKTGNTDFAPLIDQSLKKYETEKGGRLELIRKDLQNTCSQFCSSLLYKKIKSLNQVWSEYGFEMMLPDGSISGYIDLLMKDGKTGIIADYKTNRIESNQVKYTAAKYRLQMAIYSLFAFRFFGESIDSVNATLYFTSPGAEYTYSYSKADIPALTKEVNDIIIGIQSGKFPANKAKHCEFCQYSSPNISASGNLLCY